MMTGALPMRAMSDDRVPDGLAEDHDRRAGDRHADERKRRHRRRQSQRLAERLRALAARVAREVRDVQAQRRPVADVGGERGGKQRPERRLRLLQPRRLAQDAAQAAAGVDGPQQQRQPAAQQQRRRPALQQPDALEAAQDDADLDRPERGKRDPHAAGHRGPARPGRAQQRVQRQPANPRLDAEPAARDDRAQHGRDVGALDAEARPAQHRERHAVLRAGVRVEDHRAPARSCCPAGSWSAPATTSCPAASGRRRACRW